MKDCIFCQIVKKELPAYIVYEDELVLAFLDIKPFSVGHTLIIPKKHYPDILTINPNTLTLIAEVSQQLAKKYTKILKADGFNANQASGAIAGQEVGHYHLHLIPRYAGQQEKISYSRTTEKIDLAKLEHLITAT